MQADITALRGDVDEVKSRLDKVARAASRPAVGGASPATASPEVKSFVDGYLRFGREAELKSVSGAVLADGGFAVPREIDAMIASQLKTVSPIRASSSAMLDPVAFRASASCGRWWLPRLYPLARIRATR